MLPSAPINKANGNVGAVKPSVTGVLAIIAFSTLGTANQAQTFTRQTDVVASRGIGPLTDFAAYYMQNAKLPALCITPTCTTQGTYGSVTKTGTGTFTATATSGTFPADDYDVIVEFLAGGALGTTGITYEYTLDGGNNWSGTLALGTGLTISLNAPVVNLSTGVEFTLATTGTSTVVAGDSFTCFTTRPQMQSSDLITALQALFVTKAPWDNVLIDVNATSTLVSDVDTWITGIETNGKYKFAWMNTRMKNRPVPATETEAAFATAMGSLLATTSTINVDVGTDGGYLPSPVTGLVMPRPASLAIATRKMSFGLGVDPAFTGNGPVPGFQISDSNGNPLWHDEAIFPGLDALRLSTFRSLEGEQGVYITNANILSASGSSYVYDQHATTMNAACQVAFAQLALELSKGVQTQPPDPTSGAEYILETDAEAIDQQVNPPVQAALSKQVQAVEFALSRTDNLAADGDGPVTVTADLQVQYLKYIKTIQTTAVPVSAIETISVSA